MCQYQIRRVIINTMRPRKDGRRFSDDTFERIFLKENVIILIKISLEFIPNGPQKHLKPFWSEMIQPHKDCSLFWHSIWVENGKPRNGIIAQIMRQTRAKYHYFVR